MREAFNRRDREERREIAEKGDVNSSERVVQVFFR